MAFDPLGQPAQDADIAHDGVTGFGVRQEVVQGHALRIALNPLNSLDHVGQLIADAVTMEVRGCGGAHQSSPRKARCWREVKKASVSSQADASKLRCDLQEVTAIPGVTPKETSLRTGTARQNAYENLA